jgi:hypothetical protein
VPQDGTDATARPGVGSAALLGVGISASAHDNNQPPNDPYLAEGRQALKVGRKPRTQWH